MLADTAELARDAAQRGQGLAAFNVVLLDHAEAFIDAAQEAQLPLVLQLSQNAVAYHGGRLAPIGRALIELASEATVPVSVHLDHAESTDLCRAAVDLGFTSIMYDGSVLPDDVNRATTAAMVEMAHASGVSVEAELGEVGGKNGVHDPKARTKPEDAAQFVADTGVDLLAMATRDAVLDTELIAAIKRAVPVPLVLHGSSGVPDDGMVAAINAGMTKINVSTHLNVVFTSRIRDILLHDPGLVDPRKYVGPATGIVRDEVRRLMELYAPWCAVA